MNIFYLDENPKVAAEMNCDKHVVKMILETAQLLCTAHRVLDGIEFIDNSSGRKIKRWALSSNIDDALYKATHINHPSAVWARATSSNYKWLYAHFIALCKEYTYRYGKVHLTETKLAKYLDLLPDNIPMLEQTEMPQAMPDYCKVPGNSVQAYRKYYINEKSSMLNYTRRGVPLWLKS